MNLIEPELSQHQFTVICLNIFQSIKTRSIVDVMTHSKLKHDTQAKPNLPGQKALKFCIWGKDKNTFWDRNFASYHLIYNYHRELSAEHDVSNATFQVRFMFFKHREKCGSGRFNNSVEKALRKIDGENGFSFRQSWQLFNCFKHFHPAPQPDEWADLAAKDLGWLIGETFPLFNSHSLLQPSFTP